MDLDYSTIEVLVGRLSVVVFGSLHSTTVHYNTKTLNNEIVPQIVNSRCLFVDSQIGDEYSTKKNETIVSVNKNVFLSFRSHRLE